MRRNLSWRRLVVVLVDGTVATSTVTGKSASGVDEPVGEGVGVLVTVDVDEEEDKGESDLGGTASQLGHLRSGMTSLHVEDTVGDDLGVDRDLVGSLGQGPDDGVSGPKAVMSTGQLD
jgi:hypothetical protein